MACYHDTGVMYMHNKHYKLVLQCSSTPSHPHSDLLR